MLKVKLRYDPLSSDDQKIMKLLTECHIQIVKMKSGFFFGKVICIVDNYEDLNCILHTLNCICFNAVTILKIKPIRK